jgi:hypothetical protein
MGMVVMVFVVVVVVHVLSQHREIQLALGV